MLKKTTYMGIMLGATLTLGACSTKVEETQVEVVTEIENPITIDFWHSMSGELGEVLGDIVDDFNNTVGKEKGITVEATYQGGYIDAKAKVMASLKSGNAPEIVQGTNGDIMEIIQSGYIQELNPYIFNEDIGIKDFEDIYEVYRNESKGYTNDDKYYSLPFSKSTDLLFYNETFFTEHGLSVPTTWDELVEVSKQITDITGKPSFGIDNTANYFITMLKQLGGDYTNLEGELLFNNIEAIKTLEMLQNSINDGYWRLAGEDGYCSAPFLSQNLHMYIGSSAGTNYLITDDFNWEATAIPQWDDENQANISQGNNVAIINQNKTSEEVYGAYEFIKYLVSYEGNLKWATNTGYLPVRESVANSSEYQEIMSHNSDKQNAVKSIQHGFIEATFVHDNLSSNIVRSTVGTMIESIVTNGTSIEEELEFTINQLNKY